MGRQHSLPYCLVSAMEVVGLSIFIMKRCIISSVWFQWNWTGIHAQRAQCHCNHSAYYCDHYQILDKRLKQAEIQMLLLLYITDSPWKNCPGKASGFCLVDLCRVWEFHPTSLTVQQQDLGCLISCVWYIRASQKKQLTYWILGLHFSNQSTGKWKLLLTNFTFSQATKESWKFCMPHETTF